MSRWANGQILSEPDEPVVGYPGWVWRDCHCCAGTQWGGEEPRECMECVGQGRYAVHVKTGTLAEYPGGPLLGRCAPASAKAEET